MNITREIKKQKAIEFMKKLDIYKPYIEGFKKNDTICYFENFGGFWAYQEPELIEKIKEFEEEYNCLVYAVTHEYLEFGECYDFIYIRKHQCDVNVTTKEKRRLFLKQRFFLFLHSIYKQIAIYDGIQSISPCLHRFLV